MQIPNGFGKGPDFLLKGPGAGKDGLGTRGRKCTKLPINRTRGRFATTCDFLPRNIQQSSSVLGRGVSKSFLVRSGSISEIRRHKYYERTFETNPIGPVPGSDSQITRQKIVFLIGVRFGWEFGRHHGQRQKIQVKKCIVE